MQKVDTYYVAADRESLRRRSSSKLILVVARAAERDMMAEHGAACMLAAALALGVLAAIPAVESIGVCYGVNGDGLPSASDVVELYKSNGISAMRIYYPDGDALRALSGTNIGVIMDVGNDQLGSLASDPAAASSWVQDNVVPYQGAVNIRYIAVGNEVSGGDAGSILPAMQNLNSALSAAGLGGIIKVSTAVSQGVTAGYPPSKGTFSSSYMAPIAQYLASTGAPLLANVYPYFSYVGTPGMDIGYALFTAQGTVVPDSGNGYQNLFDALVDTFYSALESAGAGGVAVVVSESGWPSDGGAAASVANAQTYNQNLINHVGQGTPKRPGAMEAFVFTMFNEDKKGGDETEKHFGLFNTDKSPAYSISF